MTVPTNIFDVMPAMPYESLRSKIQNGDLLLCSGDARFSRLIQWATRSPWSHVGVIVTLPHVDRLMVLQSVTGAGVSTVSLSGLINGAGSHRAPYPGRLLIARHADFAAQVDNGKLRDMAAFAVDRFGSPYASGEVLKVLARICAGWLNLKMPPMLQPDDEFICSEYAAACYEKTGIEIQWDGLGFIAPCDFALDPKVSAVGVIQSKQGQRPAKTQRAKGVTSRG